MTRLLVPMILLSSSAAGCIVATPVSRPVAVEERCPDDRYWDGHKCKKDKWEKDREKEERKEEKEERKREKHRDD